MHREQYYDERIEHRRAVKRLVESAEKAAFNPLSEIESVVFADGQSDREKVLRVQDILSNGREYRSAAAQQVSDYNEQSRRLSEDADYFDILESHSVKLQNRVAEIVKAVDFQGDQNNELTEAIRHYKDKGGGIGDGAPIGFLSDAPRLSPSATTSSSFMAKKLSRKLPKDAQNAPCMSFQPSAVPSPELAATSCVGGATGVRFRR